MSRQHELADAPPPVQARIVGDANTVDPDLVEPTSSYLRRPLRKLSDVIKANGERSDFPRKRRNDLVDVIHCGQRMRYRGPTVADCFAGHPRDDVLVERLLAVATELRYLPEHQLSTLSQDLAAFARSDPSGELRGTWTVLVALEALQRFSRLIARGHSPDDLSA